MKKTIFISRKLSEDSIIKEFALTNDVNLIDRPLLIFEPISFDRIPKGDWLFFYSKSGVKYFIEQLEDRKVIQKYKVGCFGPSTAKVFNHLMGYNSDFVGDGIAENVPKDFYSNIELTEKVVFVRAENSKMTVQNALKDKIECKDLIAYSNKINESIGLSEKIDFVFLTSPLSADAFFTIKSEYKGAIITIGETTSKHIRDNYRLECLTANKVTEASMLEAYKSII